MKYILDDIEYIVEIQRKNNKNIYVRINDDLTIQVSARKFTTKKDIRTLLDNNQEFLRKAISKKRKENEKNNKFLIFGEPYEVVVMPQFKNIKMVDKVIYTPDEAKLEKWLKKEMKRIFEDRVRVNYMKFTENIPYPEVKLRSMKTRWGVCNRKKRYITLNSRLIKESIDKLDYVIIHELSHFVHFDHSKEFWTVVAKYCPKYKQIRKDLRE